MSNKALTWVFDNYKAGARQSSRKLMLVIIADQSNDFGECYPSVKTLARKCSVSHRSAQRILSELEDEGQLYVDLQDGMETPHGQTNRYYLTAYRKAMKIETAVDRRAAKRLADAKRGVTDDTPPLSPTTPQGVSPTTPKPLDNPAGNPKSGEETSPDCDEPQEGSDTKTPETERRERVGILAYMMFRSGLDSAKPTDAEYKRAAKLEREMRESQITPTPDELKAVWEWHKRVKPDISLPRNAGAMISLLIEYREATPRTAAPQTAPRRTSGAVDPAVKTAAATLAERLRAKD